MTDLTWNAGVGARFTRSYQKLFERIGAGALSREQSRELPYEQIAWLREEGFTALLVPRELGGGGATRAEAIELLAQLASYDANVAHIQRTQLSTIDRALTDPGSSAENESILRGVVAGDFYGAAILERSSAEVGTLSTRLTREGDHWRLTGTKYYSTSALFASKLSVLAQLDPADDQAEPQIVSVTIAADAEGVRRVDDWAGFGQRLTGSGTTVFDGVVVPDSAISSGGSGHELPGHAGALLQLILLAVIDGITRNVVKDGIDYVARRDRAFSNAAATLPRHDPIVQETLGEIIGRSYAVSSAVHRSAEALDRSAAAQLGGDEAQGADATWQAQIEVAQAQLVVVENALKAATALFDLGGASTTDLAKGYDRHWRNIRTIATHNPHRNKARLLGDVVLNDRDIENNFLAGKATRSTS